MTSIEGSGALLRTGRTLDPLGTLMDGLTTDVGARRWVLTARRDGEWSSIANEPSHLDDLYLQVAAELKEPPTIVFMSTPELGSHGLRLEAGGVRGVAVVVFDAGPDPVIGFLEEAERSHTDAIAAALPSDALIRIGVMVLDAADAAARAAELHALSSWLPTLRELARDEIGGADALEPLAAELGAPCLIALRRQGESAQASVVWSTDRGRNWEHHDGPVSLHVDDRPLSEEEVNAIAASLQLPQVGAWTLGTSNEARPLVVAAPAGKASPHCLSVAASLMSAASRRGRDLAAARTNALLQERARIASVIHEGITQVLTNVILQMEILDRLMEDPEKGRDMLTRMRGAVLEALDSLRGAILELTPAAPEWSDLAGGLDRFSRDFGAQWGLEVRYEVAGKPRDVDPEILALVFGFVQEGLSNVRKHAGVIEADITLRFDSDLVKVEVADAGKGFDPSRAEEEGLRQHQGLSIMRSRARLAGGAFDVRANQDGGTTVSLELLA